MVDVQPSWGKGEVPAAPRNKALVFLEKTKKRIQSDLQARASWLDNMDQNIKRRYGRLNRRPTNPWPGCSAIDIPIIDMKMDLLKAAILNITFSPSPMVRFLSRKSESFDKAIKAETHFDWLVKTGMPDFFEQQCLAVDDWAQVGISFEKCLWEYETSLQQELIEADKLPYPLRNMRVRHKSNALDVAIEYQQSRGKYVPITREQFDQMEPVIKKEVKRAFRLGDNDVDKKAMADIMRFLRNGEKQVKITRRIALKDNPASFTIHPRDLIIRPEARSLEVESGFTHRLYFSPETLLRKCDSMNWNKDALNFLLDKQGEVLRGGPTEFDEIEQENDDEYRYADNTAELARQRAVMLYEHFCYFDINGDGRKERCSVLFHPDAEGYLAFRALRDQTKWPVVATRFEINDPRILRSRGVAEKLADFAEEITQTERAKIDRMRIANSLTLKARRGSGINAAQLQWVPGDVYFMNRMDDLEVINFPNIDASFDRQINMLMSMTESYIGVQDFSVTALLGKTTEPKTAEEIKAIRGQSNSALGYRAMLWQFGKQRVYNRLWDLEQDYGSDDVYIAVNGETPERLTKAEIAGDYDIVPVGTTGNASPEFEAQKALTSISLLMQWLPVLMQDPRYKWNPSQLIVDYFMKSDPFLAKRFVERRSDEEVQQIVQQQQQTQEGVQAMNANIPMDMSSLMQNLDQASGEAPHGGRQQLLSVAG